jgi:HAD superfamily hydrolase (TIGR01509 family)
MTAAKSFQAVVFDMDGVLVDTEPAFFDAANDVLSDEGVSIDWKRYEPCLGTSVEETWRSIIEILSLSGDLEGYLRRYGEALASHLSRPRQPLTGADDLLDKLDAWGVPHALATSSWRSWADTILKSAGLGDRFAVLVTAKDVAQEKPAPDVYLEAAARLGRDPRCCIAIEDTLPGIIAAQRAGMFTIQVRGSTTALPPIERADLVIDSLQCFPLELLDRNGS